jgi:hypothetical protein
MSGKAFYAFAMLLFLGSTATASTVGVSISFSDHESSIIRTYYRDQGASKSKKNEGRKTLPPGIAKNLQRGKPLPSGIAKQVLPIGLIDLLPPPPRGFERIEVAGKILLVEIATKVIHDILEHAILK